MFAKKYADVFKGEANWRKIAVKGGLTYAWDDRSTYVQGAGTFTALIIIPFFKYSRICSAMRMPTIS